MIPLFSLLSNCLFLLVFLSLLTQVAEAAPGLVAAVAAGMLIEEQVEAEVCNTFYCCPFLRCDRALFPLSVLIITPFILSLFPLHLPSSLDFDPSVFLYSFPLFFVRLPSKGSQ